MFLVENNKIHVKWHVCDLLYVSVLQDLQIVYSYLHGMEALSNLREHQLRYQCVCVRVLSSLHYRGNVLNTVYFICRLMCETVRYEQHEANEVLY